MSIDRSIGVTGWLRGVGFRAARRRRDRAAEAGVWRMESLEARLLMSAGDDAYGMMQAGSLQVTAPGVLANDAAGPGQNLAANLVQGPANGLLNLNFNGGFTYTPSPNFIGQETFEYALEVPKQVISSYNSRWNIFANSGFVVLANPVAGDPDFYETWHTVGLPDSPYDGPPTPVGPSPIEYGGVTGFFPGGPKPLATVLGPPEVGLRYSAYFTTTFEFNDDLDLVDHLRMTYLVDDGAVIYLNGHEIHRYNLPANVPDTFELLANAAGDENTFYTVDASAAHLVNGLNVLAISVHQATVVSADLGFDLEMSVISHAVDGMATVTIDVADANRPPAVAADSYTLLEDTPLNTAAMGMPGLYGNDGLLDAFGAPFDPISQVVLNLDGLRGTLDFNAATGHFTFTPEQDFFGVTSFSYQPIDKDGAAVPATVTFTVSPVNDVPAGNAEGYDQYQGRLIEISAAAGLMSDETDVEGDALTIELIAAPQHGEFSLGADGSFSYQPQAGFLGIDTIVYRLSDGQGWSEPITAELRLHMLGDVNHDGTLDTDDIDALQAAALQSSHHPLHDLTRDGVSTAADVTRLVQGVFLTRPGDLDLNHTVSVGDLVVMASHFGGPGGWLEGDLNGDGMVSIGDLTLMAEHFGFAPPAVEAGLESDTAPGEKINGDLLTSDATIIGRVLGRSGLSSVRVGLDSMTEGQFVDVTASLVPTELADISRFRLTRAELDAIAGAALADGPHTLKVMVVDGLNNSLTSPFEFTWTLDTTSPVPPTFELAPESDSGDAGDGTTVVEFVTLSGAGEPGSVIFHAGSGHSTLVGPDGTFTLADIGLPLGTSQVTLQSTDAAGLSSFQTITLERQERFAAGAPVDYNSATWHVATGDVNGDGKIDIISSNFGSSFLMKLGNGDGTFGSTIHANTNISNGVYAHLADVNNDGKLDLLGTHGSGFSSSPNVMTVKLGNGDGFFGTTRSFPTGGNYPNVVRTADIDHDGDLDAVVGHQGSSTVTVFRGSNNGVFAALAVYHAGVGASDVDLADVNGDTHPDLVYLDYDEESRGYFLAVRAGDGTGNFGAPQFTNLHAPIAWKLALGDLDGDGILDVVSVGAYDDQNYRVFKGDGQGGFLPTGVYAAEAPRYVTLADMDGDGDLDIVGNSQWGAHVLLNIGGGLFDGAGLQSYTIGNVILHVAAADFNNDGALDMILSDSGAFVTPILFNRGVFTPAPLVGDSAQGGPAAHPGQGLVDALALAGQGDGEDEEDGPDWAWIEQAMGDS